MAPSRSSPTFQSSWREKVDQNFIPGNRKGLESSPLSGGQVCQVEETVSRCCSFGRSTLASHLKNLSFWRPSGIAQHNRASENIVKLLFFIIQSFSLSLLEVSSNSEVGRMIWSHYKIIMQAIHLIKLNKARRKILYDYFWPTSLATLTFLEWPHALHLYLRFCPTEWRCKDFFVEISSCSD